MSVLLLFAAILGACIGSFCNVLIFRLKDETSIGGRSRCLKCRKELKPQHLIPVFSWLALHGRCAFCRASVHWQYPVVEMMGALIGIASITTAMRGEVLDLERAAFTAALSFFLLVIATFDVRWGLVPVAFVAPAAAVLAGWNVWMGGIPAVAPLALGIVLVGGLLWLLVLLGKKRWMGEGDPVVGVFLGAALGWPLAGIALWSAFVIGGACATALLLTGRVRGNTALPFVPFLALGTVVAYFWGSALLGVMTF